MSKAALTLTYHFCNYKAVWENFIGFIFFLEIIIDATPLNLRWDSDSGGSHRICCRNPIIFKYLMTYLYVCFAVSLQPFFSLKILYTQHQVAEKRFFPLDTPYFQIPF